MLKFKWMYTAFLFSLFSIYSLSACAETDYPLEIHGTLQSGGTAFASAIADATVTLYKSSKKTTTSMGTAITNHAGTFRFVLSENQASTQDEIFYVIANKNKTTKLATIIGKSTHAHITINEMTTIAAAYSMAQFFHGDQIYGNALGLSIAASMSDNLVSSGEGRLSTLIQTSPNADETNAMRSLSSLSNLLVPCVQNVPDACTSLLSATTVARHIPENTLEAVLNIVHNPANNVSGIYFLADTSSTYTPKLETLPDAWTLAIKFNDSGSEHCPFGGPAKIAFDAKGFLWITNNVIQGTPDSATCAIVLQPNGQPADGRNNTPTSPLWGGGLLGTAFGINIDKDGAVWMGDFGWGSCATCIPTTGSVSKFSPTGEPLSGANGYTSNILRAQQVIADKNNNIWIASAGNDRIVVFPNGNPDASFYYQEPENSGPFDIAIGEDDVVWVSNSTSSIISRYKLKGTKIVLLSETSVGDSPKQISLDSQGHAWLASFADSSVYEMNAFGEVVNVYSGIGGLSKPWGISVDGEQNIWIANFEHLAFAPT
ncbi:MAG: NHL repeat-containing protein, partial [Gammaproteobacteria bacterium]|nr:NHL repeat-containing protein [Gammaproteobacteria bacterium]